MCFAIPLQAVKKQGNQWLMEDGRMVRSAVGQIKKGDFLICQHDLAVEKLNKQDALHRRKAIKGVSDELQKRH